VVKSQILTDEVKAHDYKRRSYVGKAGVDFSRISPEPDSAHPGCSQKIDDHTAKKLGIGEKLPV